MSFIHSGQNEGHVTGYGQDKANVAGVTEGEAEHTEGEAGDSETSEATVLYCSKFDLLH